MDSTESMPPCLLCSLGNPGAAYSSTLHSAGHVLLVGLRSLLDYPAFTKSQTLAKGSVSQSSFAGDITLWQSPSYMNDSGKAVRKAWDAWRRDNVGGRLVIVHDELERSLGTVVIRDNASGLSARGHNGLKSCLQHLKGIEGDWIRVGVGIGRPMSRDPEDVAKYVLRKMNAVEKAKVEGAAGEVLERLRSLG